MDTVPRLCIHSPVGTGRRILTGLLVLAVLALAGCGTPATTPTAVAEDCWQAIAAGDTEAAMDLFIEDALVTVEQTVYDGKDRIRYWIEKDIPFLTAARECSEWSDVNEATDRLDFYESCNFEEAPQQRHHTLFFENGKIRSWTMTLQRTE